MSGMAGVEAGRSGGEGGTGDGTQRRDKGMAAGDESGRHKIGVFDELEDVGDETKSGDDG